MNPLYRADTYCFEAVSPLAFARPAPSGATQICVRDLAFFPGGGGQPAETAGSVVEIRGERFGVADLVKEKGDVLIVLDREIPGWDALRKGEPVRQVVDRERRLRAARLHSAQHAFGAAVRLLVPGAVARGMRIADDLSGCAMQAEVDPGATLPEDLGARIVETVRGAVAADLPVRVVFFPDVDAARAACGDAFRVDPSLTFSGNRLRTVTIGDGPLYDASLCGGTHVRSLAEVGGVVLNACARTDDRLRVAFALA